MSDTAARAITQFVAELIRRKRWLAVKDRLIVAFILAGLLAATLVGLQRLFFSASNVTVIILGLSAVLLAGLVYTGWRRVGPEVETVSAADASLSLDDRLVSAYQIVKSEHNRAELQLSGMQLALVEDAASRLEGVHAANLVSNRLKRWYALAPAALVALIVALNLPSRSLPRASESETATENVVRAGEQLEQGSEEIQKLVPVTTTTARLAREQAEIGASFRKSPGAPVEALKRLSEVADKIRQRHAELEQTKADEIVAMADSRLQPAVVRPAQRTAQPSNPNQIPETPSAAGDRPLTPGKNAGNTRTNNTQSTPQPVPPERAGDGSKIAEKTPAEPNRENSSVAKPKEGQPAPDQPAPNPDIRKREMSRDVNANSPGRETSPDATSARSKSAEAESPPSPAENPASNPGPSDAKQPDQNQPPAGEPKGSPSILPGLSEQLMKQALELKAGQLDEKDIKNLVNAAKLLSKDLERLAQSKELRQALEEMARKVSPEQLEQVARELSRQEGLKRELEAAARLLEENQQAREIIAGMAEAAEPFHDQMRAARGNDGPAGTQQRNRRDGGAGDGGAAGDPKRKDTRGASGETLEPLDLRGQLENKGRAVRPGGKLRPGEDGQYLFLQSKAGTGPARVPYSSAYPKYRRDAERRVVRSQVPPAMRSMVRSYFDAINPNDKD